MRNLLKKESECDGKRKEEDGNKVRGRNKTEVACTL